jgi:hypothetical protein
MENIEDKDDEPILDDLDTSWLDEFEKIDNEYKIYYNENQIYVRIHFIYIDENNEIFKIREHKHFFARPNTISKEELIAIIKSNSSSSNKLYSLLSILKFNIDIQPQDLKSFLKQNYVNDRFLQSIKHIDNIVFDKSISIFHDINALFIIFYEKHNILKPLYPTSSKNVTKKVFITSNANKNTRRKQFKAINIS